MNKTIFLTLITVLFFNTVKSQVLYSENFDSYPIGHLNTDYTASNSGQGGWLVSRNVNGTETATVVSESGKGKVLTIKTNATSSGINLKQDTGVIDALWNNRIAGNNVLKFEYEFYGSGNYNAGGGLQSQGSILANIIFFSSQNYISIGNWLDTVVNLNVIKNYGSNDFPNKLWINVEIFMDYNTNNIYYYIPTLNLFRKISFTHTRIPDNIELFANFTNPPFEIKFDNIKLSALQAVPAYVLNASDFISSKFNLFPNPSTNIVNITNSENMLVQNIKIYDLTGKLIDTKVFNNDSEIQLNVEILTTGTYLLHLQTNEGTASKKLIKK